ncbi:hypothetical protein P691DRAFT_642686, partial [Macrolepiota fuliginosa MF-IS2]
ELVWSCLVTIFACTWVAVHPNMPRPCDSGWTVFRQRMKVMVYAVLGPEFVTMWALRQRIGAAGHVKGYNEMFWRCWTLAHGFLLEMEGLVLYKDGIRSRIIKKISDLPERFDIGEEEITDKSKGDFLTKLLIVFQTSWFIFQCVARWSVGLLVTELEVVTLAFAFLNIITYALWWNKPQNMRVGIAMHVHTPAPPREGRGSFEEEPKTRVGSGKVIERPEGRVVFFPDAVHSKTPQFLPPDWREMDASDWFFFIARPIEPLLSMFFDTSHDSAICPSPMLYASKDGLRSWKSYFPFCIIATIFGCLHLIPVWTSTFPSYQEMILWQVAAFVVTIQPALILCVRVFTEVKDSPVVGSVFWLVTIVGGLGYVIARVILIVLAVTSLRSLPPGAYRNVAWTTFLPHI